VFSWGRGAFGALGHGDCVDRPSPLAIEKLASTAVSSIACGAAHSVCANRQGTVFSWGHGGSGRLGLPELEEVPGGGRLVPTLVSGVAGVYVVACGGAFTVCMTTLGALWAFGSDAQGCLGRRVRGEGGWQPECVDLPPGTAIVSVTCGPAHCAALSHKGELWTWGVYPGCPLSAAPADSGLLLPGSAPVCLPLPEPGVQVACGGTFTLVLTASGNVLQSGGTADAVTKLTPCAVRPGDGPKALTATEKFLAKPDQAAFRQLTLPDHVGRVRLLAAGEQHAVLCTHAEMGRLHVPPIYGPARP